MASTEDNKPASAGNVRAAIGNYDTKLKTELGGGMSGTR